MLHQADDRSVKSMLVRITDFSGQLPTAVHLLWIVPRQRHALQDLNSTDSTYIHDPTLECFTVL